MSKSDYSLSVPHHPMPAPIETAKHLANAAKRFAADKATVGDVEEAYAMWWNAVQAAKASSKR